LSVTPEPPPRITVGPIYVVVVSSLVITNYLSSSDPLSVGARREPRDQPPAGAFRGGDEQLFPVGSDEPRAVGGPDRIAHALEPGEPSQTGTVGPNEPDPASIVLRIDSEKCDP